VGEVVALAGTLNVIETPVVGLASFTNTLDAEVGRNIETDLELKQRQNEELQVAGKSTFPAIISNLNQIEGITAVVVFQNNSDVVDIEGRPPHSVDIVVEGGDLDDIAEEIFDTVAGGITMIGAITRNVTDSQGFIQTVKFSRPTDVPIWVEVDITKDASLYPIDGDVQVENAILAYGAELGVGEDIIVFGTEPTLATAIASITGITDFDIRVGTAVNPTQDNNVVITARQLAKFDSSRIQVVSV
jgi:uncharacterized phage protein gp47/JayE